ncbi:MAG: thermonuclease family protein [Clostridium sp.]|nr:thermonuclease family protein [Clostridia bacterium]MBQ8999790.1 thermonuclease family protein [Clostridium sp.]MBQ9072692.1 thermonuclease family protein [Bacilli bacterium]
MEGERYLAKVIRIIDGDTIKVLVEGREIVIRILLIDTPEIRHPKKPKEKFGEEASIFANEKLKVDSEIYIEFEGSMLDIYNRFLAHIWYKEDEELKLYQEEILLEGLAIVSFTRYYSESKYIERLIEAETIAKELRKNIWSE